MSIVYFSSIVEDSDASVCWVAVIFSPNGRFWAMGDRGYVLYSWAGPPKGVMRGLWMLNVPANPKLYACRLLLLASLLRALALALGIDLGSEGAGIERQRANLKGRLEGLTPPTSGQTSRQ